MGLDQVPARIVGAWQVNKTKYQEKNGISTNLAVYRKERLNLSKEKAAFKTPTGKLAERNGYRTVTVDESNPNNIQAIFTP